REVGDVNCAEESSSVEARQLVLDRSHATAVDAYLEAAVKVTVQPQFVALRAGDGDVARDLSRGGGRQCVFGGPVDPRFRPDRLIGADDDRRGALVGQQLRVLGERPPAEAPYLGARR